MIKHPIRDAKVNGDLNGQVFEHRFVMSQEEREREPSVTEFTCEQYSDC